MKLRLAKLLALGGAASMAVAAACSSFGEADAPGGSDGGDDSGGDDSGADSRGRTDAPFCTGVDASFCWSFDESPFVQGPYLKRIDLSGEGGLDVVGGEAARSPPNALRVEMDDVDAALANEPSFSHYLRLDLPTAARRRLRCEADIWVERVGGRPAIVLSLEALTPRFVLEPNGGVAMAAVRIPNTASPGKTIRNLLPQTWEHFTLEVELDGKGGVVGSGSVGDDSTGMLAYRETVDSGATDKLTSSSLGLAVANGGGNGRGSIVRFDNFVCRY